MSGINGMVRGTSIATAFVLGVVSLLVSQKHAITSELITEIITPHQKT